MATQPLTEPTYEPISAWALVCVLSGRILTWADLSATEARDSNLELESDGELMEWLRLEFLN